MKTYKNTNMYFIFVLKPIVDALEWRAAAVAKSCQRSFFYLSATKTFGFSFSKNSSNDTWIYLIVN